MSKKVIVIGGGFAGCLSAHLLKQKGYTDVTLIESANFLGGGCKTLWHGPHPYTLGPRHFLTQDRTVWDFMNKYCPMAMHGKEEVGQEFFTFIEDDQKFFHFPIHEDELPEMTGYENIKAEIEQNKEKVKTDGNLEEYWLNSVGPTLYNKFVNKYSKKMWDIDSNTEITDFGFTPKGVALQTGSKVAWKDAFSGFPYDKYGFDKYFDIATEGVDVKLNTFVNEFDVENNRLKIGDEWHSYDMLVSTISPEILLKSCYGDLRWAGRDFLKIILPVEKVLPDHVFFLYYANDEPFTRIVEYKKYYKYEHPYTLLGIEMPSNGKNKLYPYPMKKDQDLHKKYIESLPKNVFNLGRNATYRYLDMGATIQQAFKVSEDW